MTTSKVKPPLWFWVVSVIALLWNIMGVDQYIGQAYKTDRWLSTMTDEQLEMASNFPAQLTGVFAVAVFAATIGSLGLLLRKKCSYPLFIISLIAVIIQMGCALLQGPSDDIAMTISIIVFALFLVWFSKKAVSKQWIS